MDWMLYGANGYTGALIAREAKKQGKSPILGGRNAARIAALRDELQLSTRVFCLDAPSVIRDNLGGISLVVNCAGPFSATAGPLIRACIAAKAHYLDITGEIDVFEAARLQLQEQTPVQGVYTFGQPRAGNYSFAKAFDRALEGRAIRFVNNNDIVPHVPLSGPVLRYWHTKGLIYIDTDGNLKPDIPYLKRLRDSLRGAAQDLGKLGPDALKDHSMDSYVRHIRQSIK
ncbi:MAG: saccharopine dehydrogenase NADP-binding domain-containing protein [Beijerinckiaceae bacterium]|nr:saccharopine dehydrogenase NADP-binding domain-containing protein [Beijerinckiaceae bacterium]